MSYTPLLTAAVVDTVVDTSSALVFSACDDGSGSDGDGVNRKCDARPGDSPTHDSDSDTRVAFRCSVDGDITVTAVDSGGVVSTYTGTITGVGSTLLARSTADTDSVWGPSSSSLTTPAPDTITALPSTVTANDATVSLADSDSCSDDELTTYVANAGCHTCQVVATFNTALVFGGDVSTTHDTTTPLAFLLPAPSVAVSSSNTTPSAHDTSSALHGRDGSTSDTLLEQPVNSDDSDDGGDGDDCSCQQYTHSDAHSSPPHDTLTATTSRFVTAGDANTATFTGGTVSTVHSTVRGCRS
jgi:hypothetical protein